ncbi:MAG: tRNA dihydrouridine synthase DusB [Bacillota bacterium]
MKIAHIDIPNPVVLAPMAGVTDLVFRRICREMGCGLLMTEMISDMGLVYSQQRTFRLVEVGAWEHPVSVQIFGSEPDPMERAAAIVTEIGGDLIDINMGCPAPKIVKNGEGSALMLDPIRAEAIVRAVVRASKQPVTVKMRAGWDSDHINAVELAKRVEDAGAAAVAVHGRTREQFYAGKADWGIIGRVKQAVSIPVIGNGDVWHPHDAVRLLRETGCDGVMIGRGVLGNPWLIKQTVHYLATGEMLPDPTAAERIEMAVRHLRDLVAYKGEYTGPREMRKHAAWYLKGLRGAAQTREQINQAKSQAEMESVLAAYLTDLERHQEVSDHDSDPGPQW